MHDAGDGQGRKDTTQHGGTRIRHRLRANVLLLLGDVCGTYHVSSGMGDRNQSLSCILIIVTLWFIVLIQEGPLRLSQVLRVAVEVSRGMDYLHQRKIIHRDLKAANLLMDDHGIVKVGYGKIDPHIGLVIVWSVGHMGLW